jgi:hypothetical protein
VPGCVAEMRQHIPLLIVAQQIIGVEKPDVGVT